MHRISYVLFIAIASLLSTGCSLVAPHYSASLENVQTLKDGGAYTAKVGKFDSSKDKANANPISMRGSSLNSPYANSYAQYLTEALKQELSLAGKLSPTAKVEVSGELLKNDIDVSGFDKGFGDISARFVVKKSGAVRYDKVKTVHAEWESSFVGGIAIPRGQQEYPKLVQQLLAKLFADASFMRALH